MDHVPLIPKSSQPENHDISHTIREVFEDVISTPEFCKNVAENVRKFNVENQNLKASSGRVVTMYDSTKLCMNNIGLVEDNIMMNHGRFMKMQNVIDKDEIVMEKMKLKRGVFFDLDVNQVKRRGLLQKLALLPKRPEQSMDFRINSDQHICPPPCPDFNDLDVYPTKLQTNERKRKYLISDSIKQRREVIFKADPESVIFENCETGITYEKKFKLINISKTTQSFIPRILSKTSFFKVELQTGSTRVAPGMCVIFAVKYQTDVYKDVKEIMTFNCYSGRDVEIKLISYRKPPIIRAFVFKSLPHFIEKFTPIEGLDSHDRGRAIALNSTIDCGSCLLGNKLKLNLILKNEGNIGQFFILNEDDWYFSEIKCVNKGMELMAQTFHIYPTYFEIDTDEFVELDITFSASKFGLETEKLFLLCNNNTLEELEIVGDGVLFESNSVTLMAEHKHQNMNEMDAKSSYFLNYGKCIPYQKLTRTITVNNNRFEVCNLSYKWEMRESICYTNGTGLKKMSPDWVSLHQTSNFLPAQSTSDFQVMLECKTRKLGLYSLVFTLCVLDIPEVSLADKKTFFVIEEPRTPVTHEFESKLLNVILGEVEIICEIVPINIQFDPENIMVPYRMSYQDNFTQKIQVYTGGPIALDCEWQLLHTNCIEIDPSKFLLNPQNTFICNAAIHIDNYEDIHETLTFVVNGGLYKKVYSIVIKVVKPVARFSENLINFGYLPKGKKTHSKTFFVENMGKETVNWQIFELYFDHDHNIVCELDSSKHLSCTSGQLDRNGSCQLIYTTDKCTQCHRWLSFLILLSSHPTLEAMDSLCLITYEVTQPEIIIHTHSSQQPILYPGKLLYISVPTLYMVCLHNTGTKLPASFIWGKPVGKHAESIKIECSPKAGIIQPQKCIHITITLLPLETGILDELYVPCFVGHLDEPIMLTVLCVVDDICLVFHLPDNEGRYEKIFWPPSIISDFEGFSLDLNHFETETEETNARSHDELYKKLNILQSTYRSSIEQTMTCVSGTKTDIKEETIPSETFHLEEENYSELSMNLENGKSSTSYFEKNPTVSTPLPIPLKDCFDSDLILQEQLLEYLAVPLRTPVKKTIILENLTPIAGNFTLEAANFYTIERNDDEREAVENILVKLDMRKRDEWEESINSNFGIVVKTLPAKGTIEPQNSTEVDIWVYANTWGTYIEEILIEVNEALPFCFNLLIQVIGVPIEFPIAHNSINNELIIRFGNIPYLSKPLQRKLKVTNFGCIPLCLVWHIFISNDTLDEQKSPRKDPFNVIIDAYHPPTTISESEDKTTLKLMVTQEYYGKEDSTIFQIQPQEISLSPKSTETITVTMNSRYYKPQFTKTQIEAYLIGHVHLAQDIIQSNVYSRQTGVNIPPAKVKLLAALELPLLTLELVKGDTRIKAYANNIIEAQEMRYEKVLTFKNFDGASAVIYMHTMSPFRIVSLQTAQTNTTTNVSAAVVQPGDCIEVRVECIIDAEEVLQYSDMLFNEKTSVFSEIPDFRNRSITLLRYLNIHQQGLKQQRTPLELVIFYPELKVSHDLVDFGVVFVGNTKKMLLTLTNPTGSHVLFTIHKPTTSTAINITPTAGIIPKATSTIPTNVTLTLYFVPRECKVYQETIRILTNIPFYSFTVNLIGAGSNNEKFYIEGM